MSCLAVSCSAFSIQSAPSFASSGHSRTQLGALQDLAEHSRGVECESSLDEARLEGRLELDGLRHGRQKPDLTGGEAVPLAPLAEGGATLVDEVGGLVDPPKQLRETDPPANHLGMNREDLRLRSVFPHSPVDDP